MCRMILSLGLERRYFEIARRQWQDNPHGWGLKFKKKKEWEEWHTVNSDVPVPILYLPAKVEGIFHIRFATSNKEMGGVHPFTIGKNMIYAHNGVITPSSTRIDSEMIGKYYESVDGENFKEKMVEVVNKLEEKHTGMWNIIAITCDGKKAFGYCDGSLVEVFEGDNIVALASDKEPFIDKKCLSMDAGQWIYLEKKEEKWEIVEMGEIERKEYYYYYGFKKFGKLRKIYVDVTDDIYEDDRYWM